MYKSGTNNMQTSNSNVLRMSNKSGGGKSTTNCKDRSEEAAMLHHHHFYEDDEDRIEVTHANMVQNALMSNLTVRKKKNN